MPYSAPKPCRVRTCGNTTRNRHGYCDDHAHLYTPYRSRKRRPSSSKRGYGRAWAKIRARVLREYGIPRERWPLYDVDHRPPYNPDVEPDHNKYTLVPMLRGEHSRKTIREDGGFGHNRRKDS